jgi:four helix bundle protein
MEATKGQRDKETERQRDKGIKKAPGADDHGMPVEIPLWWTNSTTEECSVGASFKDLVVWQRSISLTSEIYRLSASFPQSELFGLTNQMRRAAVSVASNIAEGYGRSSRREYVLFLCNARGSICELQTQLVIAENLGFGSTMTLASAAKLAEDVSRLLNALVRKLKL